MSKGNVLEFQGREVVADALTEMLRTGAQQLIHQAVEAELQELLEQHSERRTADGKSGVVRNGHLPRRKLQTGVGAVTVQSPKVRTKTGDPVTFHSALVPPYVRKTRSLEAALPWLYPSSAPYGICKEPVMITKLQQVEGVLYCRDCLGQENASAS